MKANPKSLRSADDGLKDAKNLFTLAILLAPGVVCPFSQLTTVISLQPTILAKSICRRPRSSRRLRMASPIVLGSLGYPFTWVKYGPWGQRTPCSVALQKGNASMSVWVFQ